MSREAKPVKVGVMMQINGFKHSPAMSARTLARIAGQIEKPLLQRLIAEIRTGHATAFSLTTDGLTFTSPPADNSFEVQA